MYTKIDAGIIFSELTINYKNREFVNTEKVNFINEISGEHFALDFLYKYGSLNDWSVINFDSSEALEEFKASIEDETEDTKWCSHMYFSDGHKAFIYLDL